MIALPQPRTTYARKAAILAGLAAMAENEDTRRHIMNRVAFNMAVAAGQVRP